MARSVGVAAAARARWAAAQGFELGLLLGQRAWSTSQSDAVLASAPVPPESEGGGARGFADVSTEWVADCTQQVERMLPGGVAVLGLYAVTPAAVSAADAFGKALFYLREMDAGDEPLYFVHIAGGAVTAAKSYENVGNAAKTSSAAVDIVELPANLTLKKYHTLIGISESLLFSRVGAPEDIAESRASELKKQLEPLVNRLRSAVCVVEGAEAEGSQAMKVLAPAAAKLEKDDTNCLVGRVRGAIRGVAYVCSTEPEPAKAAAEFLKKDLIKTLLLRVDLAREKWVDHEDDASQDNFELVGRVCLPKRNAIAWKYADGLSRGPFDLSIYTFPEDDISQAAEDAFEVLGGMAALAEDAGVSSLEGLWTTVEQDARTRDEKIAAARKNDPDFAPMPYHYVAMLIPVAIALAFLLMQQAQVVHRTLNGDENE